ncbi:hypothetical protein [Brachyspira aalborgi]|uniref:hypothetical protein n=1 Tax=Brachyspira aalborgi TaxID=29522 RepID=UPI002665358F|nr:hypothetical protein [Brachyspira aalborgi]
MEFNSKNEKEYYKSVKEMLKDDGIIDDSERDLLDKRKEKYAISDTRAKELEDFAINERLENKKSKVAKLRNKNIFKKEYEIKEYEDNEEVDYEIVKRRKRDKRVSKKPIYENHFLKNIWIIFCILIFELYFFVRLKATLNNPNPMAKGLFERTINWFKSSVSSAASSIIPLKIQEAFLYIDNTAYISIIIILMLLLFCILFVLYIRVPKIISNLSSGKKKERKYFYAFLSFFIPAVVTVFMIIFIESGNIMDNNQIKSFEKEATALIEKEDYLRTFERVKNVEYIIFLNYPNKYISLQNREYERVLNGITNAVYMRQSEMNETNYNYIMKDILPVYNKSIRELPQYILTYNKIMNDLALQTFENYIQSLIESKEYLTAYFVIYSLKNDEEIKFVNFDEPKSKAYKTLIDNLVNDFDERSFDEMDKENYDFIYQNIFFVYYKIMGEQNDFWRNLLNNASKAGNNSIINGIIGAWNRFIGGEENQIEKKDIFEYEDLNIFRYNEDEKKRLENKMAGARKRFDDKRDKYLEDLINLKLPHMTDEEQKNTIPLIVHYSDAKREKGGGTYKEYWNEQREKEEIKFDDLAREKGYTNDINSIISEFKDIIKNKENLKKENYEYIYKNILPRYEETVKKLKHYKEAKKDYDVEIEVLEKELDDKRHEYLLSLMNRIKGFGNTVEAKLILNTEVYHKSDRELSRNKWIGWIPFVGKTSYKQYWEKVKKEYEKALKKK